VRGAHPALSRGWQNRDMHSVHAEVRMPGLYLKTKTIALPA
jgi:hypothetical protein